jgi:CrcB protein
VTLVSAIAIGAGGACGALVRALLGRWIQTDFPYATLIVNIAGSFILAAAATGLPAGSGLIQAFIGAGFCGALTTFSTFILETVILFRSGFRRRAVVYLTATLLLCCLASWIGFLWMA